MKARRFTFIAILSLLVFAVPACSQNLSGGDRMQQNQFNRPDFSQGKGGNFGAGKTNSDDTASILTVDTSLLVKDEDDISTLSIKKDVTLNLSDFASSASSSITLTDEITATKETKGDGSTYVTIDTSATKDALNITLTGSLSKGEVEIVPAKNADIVLTLQGVSISSGNYPAINVSKASRTFLVLEGTNSLTDGRSYGTGYSKAEGTDYYTSSFKGTVEDGAELTQNWAEGSDTKGTLYTKGALLVSGTGSLNVTESYKHGIYSKDYIRIFGGTITVNNGGRSAVRSLNGFVMDDGVLNITGTGTNSAHPNDNSRGIIVEGDESSDGKGKGYIYISGGTININSTGKAISAKWDIDDDAETDSTEDDPNPVVMITGGTISVKTTDTVVDDDMNPRTITYYDVDGISVTETASCSPEGIEGKTGVIITGGKITVNTTDDALNASLDGSGYVNITGGEIYLYATQADAIDSNGDINISGGTIVTLAPMGSEDGFDCDGVLTFTGGLSVGISGSSHAYASTENTSSKQIAFVLAQSYAGSAGTTMAIKDESGKTVFAFDIPSGASSYGIITLSSPEFEAGKTYTVYSGVTASGGTKLNGVYTTLPSVSGGKSTGTITTTAGTYVYTLGSVAGGFGAGFGGGRNAANGMGGFEGQDGLPPEPPEGFEDNMGQGPRGGMGGNRGVRGGQRR